MQDVLTEERTPRCWYAKRKCTPCLKIWRVCVGKQLMQMWIKDENCWHLLTNTVSVLQYLSVSYLSHIVPNASGIETVMALLASISSHGKVRGSCLRRKTKAWRHGAMTKIWQRNINLNQNHQNMTNTPNFGGHFGNSVTLHTASERFLLCQVSTVSKSWAPQLPNVGPQPRKSWLPGRPWTSATHSTRLALFTAKNRWHTGS